MFFSFRDIPIKVYLFSILLLFFLFAAIVAFNKYAGKRIVFLPPEQKGYPLLDLYENIYKPFYGIVKEVETYSDISYITLNNGAKFSLDKITCNFECNPSQLSSFIQIGDSISKPEEDFVFFVHRKNVCYPFKIKERLRALPVNMNKKRNK